MEKFQKLAHLLRWSTFHSWIGPIAIVSIDLSNPFSMSPSTSLLNMEKTLSSAAFMDC